MATANEPDQINQHQVNGGDQDFFNPNFETFIREQGQRTEYEAVFEISFVPSSRAVAVQQGDGSAAPWR